MIIDDFLVISSDFSNKKSYLDYPRYNFLQQ